MKNNAFFSAIALCLLSACQPSDKVSEETTEGTAPIDRQALVERHNPLVRQIDPTAPFTLGNGRFAFTADVTGLQSFPDRYFREGIPLETKARWAWHSRPNPEGYSLNDTFETYEAYGREVEFPTDMDSAAGQWLRQNPHDLPLTRVSFVLDDQALVEDDVEGVEQQLDLWRGQLSSRFRLDKQPVRVVSVVDSEADRLAVRMESPLLEDGRLSISLRFPRGYDLSLKNTPDLLWGPPEEHRTELVQQAPGSAVFQRRVDDAEHYAHLRWRGEANLERQGPHEYRLVPQGGPLDLSLTFTQSLAETDSPAFDTIARRTASAWESFWRAGAAIDFSGSTDPRAAELERRVVLSRYLLASQARAAMPAQETGLTSSSWYGKHHTEMTWWHTAHWALWNQPEELEKVLEWYLNHLDSARAVAAQRGLEGARWAKMVGPDNRESPGGNPLIIWNQPQFIHLAELLYQRTGDSALLSRYATLVEETAAAMASMLVWEDEAQRYSLGSPIWIAQEIYDPRQTRNPTFELAYWREGLMIAQRWRERLDKAPKPEWQARIDKLAALPVKDGRYVGIESIPDTFDNVDSRQDHPSMLAAYGLLNDPRVSPDTMDATLQAVLDDWDWETKIWGWDYPMIAMTAARLNRPETAVEILLADLVHNRYLPNGQVPQAGAALPVYLPANGALLSAVAMMAGGWRGGPDKPFPGFPDDGSWRIKAEGFMVFP